jgi:hypothetical protein
VFISKSPTVGDEDHLAFTTPMLRGPGSRYRTSSPVTARPVIMRWISMRTSGRKAKASTWLRRAVVLKATARVYTMTAR